MGQASKFEYEATRKLLQKAEANGDKTFCKKLRADLYKVRNANIFLWSVGLSVLALLWHPLIIVTGFFAIVSGICWVIYILEVERLKRLSDKIAREKERLEKKMVSLVKV